MLQTHHQQVASSWLAGSRTLDRSWCWAKKKKTTRRQDNKQGRLGWANIYIHTQILTLSVMPSKTKRFCVSSQVPVALDTRSPETGSTAYNGALPLLASKIWERLTHPPRSPSASDSTYNRELVSAYRSFTIVDALHSGSGMASFSARTRRARGSAHANAALTRVFIRATKICREGLG